ncbi:MAG: PstS family phosphate ABC transporter substrate-binding protein [Candidatus Bipolaricaulota bacterium]|nr:PstS family phosphate ABC transporter substrate-binding protein [Candidatus Bipolaricaulota bacterium]MBS3792509.1 PstS family phosphate ABC transporter substrate-binding protein [Candidatus Bipolaricaulota bacterium]
MKTVRNTAALLTVMLVLISATTIGLVQAEDLKGEIDIAGSSTVYPVSAAMAEEFSKMHSRLRIAVKSTGTGGGFANFFTKGKTDINNASRTIKESELQIARDNGIEPIEFKVAFDAITIIVNPRANWVEDISVEELAKIWRPNNPAKKWSDLNPNWPDEEIELYGPTAASGTFDYFTENIIGEEGSSRTDYQKTEQDNTIVQAVAGSKYALGYLGMSYYLESKSRVDALAINGVKPSLEAAASGKYTPLSRPLFIYVSDDSLAKDQVREFMDYFLKQSSTKLISQVGYVPVSESVMYENLYKLWETVAKIELSEEN